jgi:hypothetical protein
VTELQQANGGHFYEAERKGRKFVNLLDTFLVALDYF